MISRTPWFLLPLGGCLLFGGGGGGNGGDDTAQPQPKPTQTGDPSVSSLLNASVTLPPGTTTLDDPETDPDVLVVDNGSSITAGFLPGDTINVAVQFSAPQGNVAGAGVRFGDTGPIYSVPVPDAAGQQSGIMQFEVEIPDDICDNLSDICHDIKCYEFAVTEQGKITAADINSIALMCNNCDEPSCQDLVTACDSGGCTQDFTTSGGNDPETFIIDVGLTSGQVDFFYDTQSIEDRVIVEHDGQVVHDSGCIGTGGFAAITLAVTTNLFTVTVEPNCAGGTSTAWDLAMGCAYQ